MQIQIQVLPLEAGTWQMHLSYIHAAYNILFSLKLSQVPQTYLLIHVEFLLHNTVTNTLSGLKQSHSYVCVVNVLSVLNDEV